LERLLFFISYQRTESADTLLKTIAEGSPHNTVRGRAAFRLAESFAESAEIARLLRVAPEILKHERVQDKAETLQRLAKADADALARQAEQWYTRVKETYADVTQAENNPQKLGPAAERGLFAVRHLATGKVAPNIEGDDLDGKKFKLSD